MLFCHHIYNYIQLKFQVSRWFVFPFISMAWSGLAFCPDPSSYTEHVLYCERIMRSPSADVRRYASYPARRTKPFQCRPSHVVYRRFICGAIWDCTWRRPTVRVTYI